MENMHMENNIEENERREILRQIEKSAESIQVPKSLEPDAVKKRLRTKRRAVAFPVQRLAKAVAVIAMVVFMGGVGIYGRVADGGGAKQQYAGSGNGSDESSVLATSTISEEGESPVLLKKANVGSYRLASGYGEVYEALRESWNELDRGIYFDTGIVDLSTSDTAGATVKEEAAESVVNNQNSSAVSDDFSKTNLQVAGVDESDFVKNDGSYLYVQNEDHVSVVDIRDGRMETVAEIEPKLGTSGSICDMYVDGDRLYLILQKREAELNDDSANEAKKADMMSICDVAYIVEDNATTELWTYDISNRSQGSLLGTVSQDGSYYTSRKVGDYIYLFSRKSPQRYNTFCDYGEDIAVDGQSVSEEDMSAPTEQPDTKAGESAGSEAPDSKAGESAGSEAPDSEEDASAPTSDEEDYSDVIPCINGEMASADCIYLQDTAQNELIVSSVNVERPGQVTDYMVLVNNYAQIYMSAEAIYLYSEDYEWTGESSKSYTDIVKFSYKDGILNGVGAATLRGTIQDTFAISEADGILRVLTTEWSTNSENRLYLLDEKLNEKGSLKHIAPGEEIYAARYIGNTAYFITYHNTDPLFAVDISNPAKPKMLGQLELTGFSDYLHPYGDGLLLGIGYETNPDTSERLGVKLVMFDISDPVNLKVLDTVTLDGSYTGAASNYKSALADPAKNLIGFEVTDWRMDTDVMRYYLYSWEDGKFVKRLKESIDCENFWNESLIRGLYAADRFFLLNPGDSGYQLRAYDLTAECKKLGELEVK